MSFFAISDLHIRSSDDAVYHSLLALISERVQAGDTLLLAGDVFDLFIGNKKIFRERYASFYRELERAGERGAQIHYIEGNHDFLLKKAFTSIKNIFVHSESVELQIGSKRFFCSHGDQVNSKEYGYRFLRLFLRSPFMKLFVKLVPGSWLDRIGNQASGVSREGKPLLSSHRSLDEREKLRTCYRSFAAQKMTDGFDFVVMGHCHDLDEKSFVVGGRKCQYINVGFPPAHGSFLSWSPPDEKIEREKLPTPQLKER